MYGGLVNPLQPEKCCSKSCGNQCSEDDYGENGVYMALKGAKPCYEQADGEQGCCASSIPSMKVCGVANEIAPCTQGIRER